MYWKGDENWMYKATIVRIQLKPTIMEIKQTMNDLGILKTKHVYLYIATKTWLVVSIFFGSSLPENVIPEPNQLGFAPGRQVHMSKFSRYIFLSQ